MWMFSGTKDVEKQTESLLNYRSDFWDKLQILKTILAAEGSVDMGRKMSDRLKRTIGKFKTISMDIEDHL